MAAEFQTASTEQGTGGAVTVDPPAGLAENDLWLVVIGVDDSSCTLNIPTDWAAVSAQHSGFPSTRAFWKKAGASETAQEFTITNGAAVNFASSVRISGQHATVPIGEVSSWLVPGGSGSTIDAPDIADVAEDASLAILLAVHSSNRAYTAPTGSTEIHEIATSDGAVSLCVAYEARDSGAYAPGDWAYAISVSGRAAQTFVVLPATAGGGGQPPRSMHQFRLRAA